MITRIEVTQLDIDEGYQGDCEFCPIARAVSVKIKPGFTCRVSRTEIALFNEWRSLMGWLKLPVWATEFVVRFDKGFPVRPFSFDLDIPEWALL